MGYWEDYFAWLWGLDADTRTAVLNTIRNMIFVREAAAGLGTTALSAEDPSAAWPYYENFENDWFGSDALNEWLATLIYPERQKRVDDTIFCVLAETEVVRGMPLLINHFDHWKEFETRLKDLLEQKDRRFNRSCYQPFLRRLKHILPRTDAPKQETRN